MKSKARRSKGSGGTTAKTRRVHTKHTSGSGPSSRKLIKKIISALVSSRSYDPLCGCKGGVYMSMNKFSRPRGDVWSLRLNTCNCSSTKKLVSHAMSVALETLDSYFLNSCDARSPSERQMALVQQTKNLYENWPTAGTRPRRRSKRSSTSENAVH